MRTGIWLAAVVVALIGATTELRADTQSCAQFRESILRMERESVRPPGWVHLAAYLRNLYAKECVVAPTRRADAEYWYREDGSPLGVRADYVPPGWDPAQPYRPEGGAYTTTPEIAAACARSVPFNPGMCAMMKGLEAACLRPVDTQKRVQCEGILAGRVPDLPPASEPLPPILDLIGPARATAPQLSSAQIQADPGFQRMCREAEGNFGTCAMRRQNMRSAAGATGLGSSGQAGAFYECQQLYSGVLNMCAATRIAATAAPPPVARPAAPPAKPAASAPGASRSAPPPQQQPQMSAQCQKLVGDYVSAAQANDGPRALAGYNALKSAGGCGVLDKVDSGPPPAQPAQAFPTRRGTPLTDSYVQPCAADQAGCAQAMRQLEQGASPEAKAALMMHAISTGLQLGATVAGGIAAMQQQGGSGASGGGTNMNSIGNRPARGTYGQGAPTYTPAPAQRPSDITGTR